MDQAAIYRFLAQHRYGVVSSVSHTGTPQSALVGIAVTPELEIVFDTLKTTRKYPNLIARPDCSLVIGWENEQTVQLEGIAREPRARNLRNISGPTSRRGWTAAPESPGPESPGSSSTRDGFATATSTRARR